MQESYNENITPANNNENQNVSSDTPTIIQTDVGAKDGQNKCPKCGATDISLNLKKGILMCNFCRHEFEAEKTEESDITDLKGQVMGSGAQDIIEDTNDIVTFKCESCGAEVVIDTTSSTLARCHWCRNTLSVNQQIPNGSVPDMVLPFSITKDDAKTQIEKFVKKRKFFAHPKFKEEFTTNNVMGVYFPYMVVDINCHAKFIGEGEHLVRSYTKKRGDNIETYYDADLFAVEREFDLEIDNLTIESNSERLNNKSSEKTNNVINSIMPFDIENCVKYNANYLKGYTSEKRDTNITQLKNRIDEQSLDIARFAANKTLTNYDRGVAWSEQKLDIKGQKWKAAYLPVWLYSYQQTKGNNKILHYVAVNARTKETMGSVPIHTPKLLLVSFLVEILGFLAMISIDFEYNWLFLSVGIIFYIMMYLRYRNSNARHEHETDTKNKMENLRNVNQFIKSKKGLSNSMMQGANNTDVSGLDFSDKILKSISESSVTVMGKKIK